MKNDVKTEDPNMKKKYPKYNVEGDICMRSGFNSDKKSLCQSLKSVVITG